jgi:ATP-dependent Lon protease
MPGRILDGIRRAGSSNPLMLLDEIDKLTRDNHGDPASALMEVLDGEQNKEFRDHFIEFPYDLSEVMFIATANSLDTIPRPLLDRMEVIELKSYSTEEKLAIAKKYLIPKQMERHGLRAEQLKISATTLKVIINSYTHEAGVRNLERELGAICRKAAKMLCDGESCIKVTPKNVSVFLGAEKIIPEKIADTDEIGVVNGLAYTELGGTLLKVEVAAVPGTGKVELTGSLGDVMKESAKAALTYIRSHCDEWNIASDFYTKKDIHIHFPEGAVPKDGPSAGVTMVSAIVSELSGRAVKRSVAMTGEVTLKGKVLAIGGLKEKTMAAYNAGVTTVLLPKENVKDLDEIDKTVRASLNFIPCNTVADVLRHAIV